MTATIEFAGFRATVRRRVWTVDPPILTKVLDATMEEVTGYDPDPDLTAALRAADLLGGRVIHHEPPPYDPDAIY